MRFYARCVRSSMLSSLRPVSSMLTRGVAAVVQHSREQRRKTNFWGCPLPRWPVVAGKAQSSPPTARGNIEGNGARGRPSRRKKEQLYRHQAVLDIQRLTTSILNLLQTLFRQPIRPLFERKRPFEVSKKMENTEQRTLLMLTGRLPKIQ